MKKIILLTFILLVTSCGSPSPTINFNEEKEYIEIREKITYYKGSPFTGTIVEYYENGSLKNTSSLKEGKPHGTLEMYYDNGGLRVKSTFIEGELNGPYESYYNNGEIEEKSNYINGILDGTYQKNIIEKLYPIKFLNSITYINGKYTEPNFLTYGKFKTNFQDGKENGFREVYFDENEQLWYRCYYVEGEKNGLLEIYFENGQLREKSNYQNGVLNGPLERYFDDGVLEEKSNYINGVLNGPFESYYLTQGYVKTTMKNGKPDGTYEVYEKKNGTLYERSTWSNGEIVGEVERFW